MAPPRFRAPDEQHEIHQSQIRRDTTPLGKQIVTFLSSPTGLLSGMVVISGISFAYPAYTILALVMILMLSGVSMMHFRMNREKLATLPLRLPLDAKGVDYNNPYPGRMKFRKGEGSFFFGNAISGLWSMGKEIWGSFTDLLTHMLVIGGTGAGKTETLVSMAFNSVAVGGGLGYVDAKAAPKLYGQGWVIARYTGRDDDVRVLNYALGQEKLTKSRFIRSNSMQPFARGKAEALKEIPLSLMASGGGGGGGSIFESNAKALMTALTMMLTEMRDMGEISMFPGDFAKYLAPQEFVAIAKRKDFPQPTQEAAMNFLRSMGWKPDEADSSKWGDFDRQYSYAQNYFLETFSMMNTTYRHIFAAKKGDINMVDVILQRRIFFCLIPSLEKSPKELAGIGKITLSVLRLATAVGLGGGEIMGTWRRLIDLGIANARVPFFLTIDEIAAIMVEGLAEMFTQGRGLGMSCTVASQDWAGIMGTTEATKKEAQQILANTKLKFFMTGDDPKETKRLMEELAGETEEFRTQGYSVNGMFNYNDTLSAQAQRVSRINALDVAGQIEGEWHLFFKGKIIRGQGFHAGAGPKSNEYPLFVHHHAQIFQPSRTALSARFGDLKTLMDSWDVIARGDMPEMAFTNPAPAPLIEVFSNAEGFSQKRRELGVAAIHNWLIEIDRVDAKNEIAAPNVVIPAVTVDRATEAQPQVTANQVEEAFDAATDDAYDPHEDGIDAFTDDDIESDDEPTTPHPRFRLPGADMLRSAVATSYDQPSTDEELDDDGFDPSESDEDSMNEVEIKEAMIEIITEPAYPLPPKPEPAKPKEFAASTAEFLAALSKKRSS